MIEWLQKCMPYYKQILIGGHILLFITLFLSVYCIYQKISYNRYIEKRNKFINFSAAKVSLKEQKKKMAEEIRLQKGFLYRMDRKIFQAGIHELSISTEKTLVIYVVIILSASFIGGILGGWIWSIIGLLIGVFLPYTIISLLASRRYGQIEKQLLTFMNLIDSYSKTSDDIIEIFEKIYFYLNAPLSGILEDCCNEVRLTGDADAALQNLSMRIGHERLEEVIANLQIAAKHEADYSIVINDERELISNYLFDKKEKKSSLWTARIEILILFGIGYGIVSMLASSFGASIGHLFDGKSISSLIVIILTAITTFVSLKMLLFSK